jgi:hypothetical protein
MRLISVHMGQILSGLLPWGTIYDGSFVDQIIGLNVSAIGGTRAATTFTGSGIGGAVLRTLNNQAVLCWVPIGAGQSCSNVMTWNASGPVFPLGLSNSNGTLLPSTALGYKSANSTGAAYVELVLTGTTGTITGTALTTTCDSGTATVTGAVVGHPVAVSSTTGADVGGAFNLRASVTATGVVTVYVCGTGTPASLAYREGRLPRSKAGEEMKKPYRMFPVGLLNVRPASLSRPKI